MNHVVRHWGGEIPTLSVPLPFPSPHSATVSLTATDKSVTLLSQSSGEWAWWEFRQWRNFAAFYMCLPPPLLFRAVPLFEWGEMLCSAVFVSVVRQMKALCVHGFAMSSARKGKGTSLFDIFFPHAPLAGRYTRKIKDNSNPSFFWFLLLFFPENHLNMGTFSIFWVLLTFSCIEGQYFNMTIMQFVVYHKIVPPVNLFMLYTWFAW